MTENLPLVLTIISTTAGAVWVIRSKMTDLEKLLIAHITATEKDLQNLTSRVSSLEAFRKKRRGT